MKENFKILFRWLFAQWSKIPRWIRAMTNLLICILLIVAFFVPAVLLFLSQWIPEAAFRYEERLNMVGPAKIVATVDNASYHYDRVILAEDKKGFALYGYNSEKYEYDKSEFYYLNKTGDITIIPLPYSTVDEGSHTFSDITIVMADLYPQAVRAELDIVLYDDAYYSYGGKHIRFPGYWTCSTEAQRQLPGYFIFSASCGRDDGTAVWYWKSKTLCTFLTDTVVMPSINSNTYSLTVRLYDAAEELIVEKEMKISNPSVHK